MASGKGKKRSRKHGADVPDADKAPVKPANCQPDEIAKIGLKQAAEQPRQGVNLVEVGGKSCTHEVAWPPPPEDSDAVPSGRSLPYFVKNTQCAQQLPDEVVLHCTGDQSQAPPPSRPGPPAKEYPFQLDPFQQTAINCLETGALSPIFLCSAESRFRPAVFCTHTSI